MSFGPGFVPTFLYYFVSTTLIAAFVASRGLGMSIGSGTPLRLGIVLGLLAGLAGGYFNRTVTRSFDFKNRKKFDQQLEGILAELGFQKADEREDGVRIYQRAALAKVLSGKVFVQFEQQSAAIAGRSIAMKQLSKRMEQSGV